MIQNVLGINENFFAMIKKQKQNKAINDHSSSNSMLKVVT